jgi:uncharacterized protein (DUF433 family)
MRTLHDWATSGVLVPDWVRSSPRGWSYRDVVYARLMAWLRSKRMDRSLAARRVALIRELLAGEGIDPTVRSDGAIILLGSELEDRFTGQQAFDAVLPLLDVFELTEPIDGVSRSELWGPSLVAPSEHTFISPWVSGGEPCIVGSRVPTAAVYALHTERGLSTEAIASLYPGLEPAAIGDAVQLERRLRHAA